MNMAAQRAGIVLALLLAGTVHAAAVPAHIRAAVETPSRPDSDRQRDAARKPAAVLAYAGIKPGDKVADFMPGRAYYTRILCAAVGETGHVYAISVPIERPPGSTPPAPAEAAPPPCPNVTAITLQPSRFPAPELHSSGDDPGWVYEYWSSHVAAENFAAPEPLDVIWTSENYHDLHNQRFGSPEMLLVNQALYEALKPGGLLIVEDHAAQPHSGARDTESLHRIEAAQVRKEVTAAGFVYAGSSSLLHHPEDPHTARAHEMHDRTDRFLLKFRKPAAASP